MIAWIAEYIVGRFCWHKWERIDVIEDGRRKCIVMACQKCGEVVSRKVGF